MPAAAPREAGDCAMIGTPSQEPIMSPPTFRAHRRRFGFDHALDHPGVDVHP